MERKIVETKKFSKDIDALIKRRQVLQEDFNSFKRDLAISPDIGDIIVGTGGIRKTRIKSASKGKSGGFRICYYYFLKKEHIYLLLIYAKSEQDNLSALEKKTLKEFISFLKR